MIEWLYQNDPRVTHERDRVLFISGDVLTVVEATHLSIIQGSEESLPFRPKTFSAVVKLRTGLTRKALKEIAHVLEWGGFLILLEATYDGLLWEFNFLKLPFSWGPFHIYQKAGIPPSGKRHRLEISCSA